MTEKLQLVLQGDTMTPEQLQDILDRVEAVNARNRQEAAITPRDWFAGRALTGLLSALHTGTNEEIAHEAYALADAMMALSREPL